MPLDLIHHEIMASPEEIDLALQKLDSNGWNTRGEPTHEVKLRVTVLTSLIRENTLELSMVK
jgi:chromatin structure-remodeling complex subunit RSC3/30